MTNFIYAVHYDQAARHSIHNSWDSAETAILGVEFPVFRKFPAQDKEIAQHFSINGVLPYIKNINTRHIFVSLLDQTHYIMYTSSCDILGNQTKKNGKLPEKWNDSSCTASEQKIATSLYALYDVFEELSFMQQKHGPSPDPIIIHFDYFYPPKCIKEWIPFWKKTNWNKSDGSAVDNSILLQIIDAQLSNLHNIHINYVHNITHKNGIYGFQQCKLALNE